MNIDIETLIGRFINLLAIKRALGLELVSMCFTESEIEAIICLLGELNALHKEQ